LTILSSLHAQQVFDRGYEMCANALFSLSVVLRFIGTEAQAQEVDTLVDALIDQTLEALRQESLRILEVVESNGIQTLAERAGFEPAVGCYPTHAFQACDLNHSSISPEEDGF
jgi:hypothetical protein